MMRSIGFTSLLSFLIFATPVTAETVQFFYQGAPGGGFDLLARSMVPKMEKNSPYKFILHNDASPGAINTMLSMQTKSKNILVLLSGEAFFLTVLARNQFSLDEFNYLGRVVIDKKVIASLKFKTFEELPKNTIFGATGVGDGNSDISELIIQNFLKQGRVVVGYKGTAAINLAIENGELDARVMSLESAQQTRFNIIAIPEVENMRWRMNISKIGRIVLTNDVSGRFQQIFDRAFKENDDYLPGDKLKVLIETLVQDTKRPKTF